MLARLLSLMTNSAGHRLSTACGWRSAQVRPHRLPAIAAVPTAAPRSVNLAKAGHTSSPRKKAKAPLPASSDVLLFDRYMPALRGQRSHDRVGYTVEGEHGPLQLVKAMIQRRSGFSPLKDATYIVSPGGGSFGAALKGGRKVLDHVIPTDW